MQKTVPIRVRPETRARLHQAKRPGQTLDDIITLMIDLWVREKKLKPISNSKNHKRRDLLPQASSLDTEL